MKRTLPLMAFLIVLIGCAGGEKSTKIKKADYGTAKKASSPKKDYYGHGKVESMEPEMRELEEKLKRLDEESSLYSEKSSSVESFATDTITYEPSGESSFIVADEESSRKASEKLKKLEELRKKITEQKKKSSRKEYDSSEKWEHHERAPSKRLESEKISHKPIEEEFMISERLEKSSPKKKYTPKSSQPVAAATHNDNEEFPSYRDFCYNNDFLATAYPWDVKKRLVLRCLDGDSATLFGEKVRLYNDQSEVELEATVPADGEIFLFPNIDFADKKIESHTVTIGSEGHHYTLSDPFNEIVTLSSQGKRSLPKQVPLQVTFLVDATGSMGDEIQKLQDAIYSIHSRMQMLSGTPAVEFSLVSYRDKNDEYVVRGTEFTSSIDEFQIALEDLKAKGGGDYPEDLEAGLYYSLDSLRWKEKAVKVIFILADAPPHLNYKEKSYMAAARKCREEGIIIAPIGASGLTKEGEYVFRQMAVLTGGEYLFLHYGEQGESSGAATKADPGKVSHHTGSNYQVKNLDDLVVDIVSHQLSFLVREEVVEREEFPEPQYQRTHLDTRTNNMLRQLFSRTTLSDTNNIIISPIEAKDSTLTNLADYIWRVAISQTPTITNASIIERFKLKQIMEEQKLSLTGATVDVDMVGNLLNATHIIFSQIHYLGQGRYCHMRLIDCESGKVVGASRIRL